MVKTTQEFIQNYFSLSLKSFLSDYYISVDRAENLQARHPKIWSWIYRVSEVLAFNSVPQEHLEELCDLNVVAVILCAMVDDNADLVVEESFFDQSLEMMKTGKSFERSPLYGSFQSFLLLSHKIWIYIHEQIQKWPHYLMLAADLEEAFDRYWYTVRSSIKLNQFFRSPASHQLKINFEDYWIQNAPGIYCLVYGIMNLMTLEKMDYREIKPLEEMLKRAELFAVIGNWTATWKAEVQNRDFSSGVIVWALDREKVTPEELRTESPENLIEKIEASGYRDFFQEKMDEIILQMERDYGDLKTIDLYQYCRSLQKLYRMHLASSQYLKYTGS